MRHYDTRPTSGMSVGARWMVVGLSLQFLLGMYTNLFVRVGPSFGIVVTDKAMRMARVSPILMVHMMVGIGLAIGATALFIVASRSRLGHSLRTPGIALGAILLAGYGGLAFFLGGQHPRDSYLMAVGWLISMGSYLWNAVQVPPRV